MFSFRSLVWMLTTPKQILSIINESRISSIPAGHPSAAVAKRYAHFFTIIHVGNEDLCTKLDKGAESKDEKRCVIICVVLLTKLVCTVLAREKAPDHKLWERFALLSAACWVYNLLLVCRKTKLHLQCLLRKR